MKIKEVENETKLDRENIRFYEKQGLIQPIRMKNGYREFSDEDLKTLLRIKLLRSIHVSVLEIKALMEGEISLSQVLSKQLEELAHEKDDLDFAQSLCKKMMEDESSLANLDAKIYLEQLEAKKIERETGFFNVKTDKKPQMANASDRIFARGIDLLFYAVMLSSVLIFGFHIKVSRFTFFEIFIYILAVLLIMLFVEPLLLTKLRTTVGKFIFGLKLVSDEGNPLTYSEGFQRTAKVIGFGVGIFIPYYNLKYHYNTYRHWVEEEKLPWDNLATYVLKEKKMDQNLAFILILIFMTGSILVLTEAQKIPPNKGELTIEEFVENYHHYEDLMGIKNQNYRLNKEGEWIDIRDKRVSTVDFHYEEKPLFWFELKDDHIKSISFSLSIENKKLPLTNYVNERLLTFLSLVGAQKENALWSLPINEIAFDVSGNAFNDYKMQKFGVHAKYEVKYEGYEEMFAVLIPKDHSSLQSLKSSYTVIIPNQ